MARGRLALCGLFYLVMSSLAVYGQLRGLREEYATMAVERSFVMIKPDGVRRGLVGE